jgi:hypothetical protein
MSRGGLAREHARRRLPLYVAPTSEGDHHNAIGPPLAPIGCWRLEAARFDFDSSVVRPEARAELALLAALMGRMGTPVPAVFGHADPVGDDEYNKTLSGRRAAAVYGLLTRDLDLWGRLHDQPFSTDDWRTTAVPLMRKVTGQPVSTPRREVFAAYMDAICCDDAGQPLVVPKEQFLGRGADPDGKADYQGCGELNPILVFSRDEGKALEANRSERNRENAPNRRVLVLLFPPGAHVEPSRWPCPRAREGAAGCRPHLWPDGDQRRAQQERRREYEADHDTFACALYDGMARRSPCEGVRKTLTVRLLGPDGQPVAGAPYRVDLGGDVREGLADAEGYASEPDAVAPSVVTFEFGDPRTHAEGVRPFRAEVDLTLLSRRDDESFRQRLYNLGYPRSTFPSDAIAAFQRDHELPISRTLDDDTRAALLAAHDEGRPRKPPPPRSA